MAGDMQAVTGVSGTAQELMTNERLREGAMTTMNCADTESGAHDSASNEFEEASSQLEELDFEYEIASEGVFFSRSGTAVEEHDPAIRTGAAPFLGLTGTTTSAGPRCSTPRAKSRPRVCPATLRDHSH
jgi:hypothetical protein